MRPRYWMTRIYMGLSAALSMLIVWIEPQSLGHQMIERSGPIGWPAVAVLGVVCVVAIVDVLINDAFDVGRRWHCARRWRHWVFMALAMGLACVSYVIVMGVGYTPLILAFLLDAVAATVIAVTDLFQQYRGENETE